MDWVKHSDIGRSNAERVQRRPRRRTAAAVSLAGVALFVAGISGATAGASHPYSHAKNARNCNVKQLERKLEKLESQLSHSSGSKHQSLESHIASIERQIKEIKAACKKHHRRKHGGHHKKTTSPPPTSSPPPSSPAPTSPPTQVSCTANPPVDGSGGNAGDVEDDDPCTNAPGKLEKFTVSASQGPINNYIAPTGFSCSIGPEGTMTCTAATPVEATTMLHFVIHVNGGTGQCPGLTLTITDFFVGGASTTFKTSC
jgi:hypothetical protein